MKLMKTTIAAALAAICSAALMPATSASAKEWKKVVIGTEGAYAPWNLTKSDGKLDGYEIELTNELCKRMKVECTYVTQDWDGAIPALVAGKYDVLMDAVSITPERLKVIDFTNPYAATPAGFAAVKGTKLPLDGKMERLTGDKAHDAAVVDALKPALKGKTIGIQTATVYTKFVTENFGDVATIREYKTEAEHDLDLAAGRIDFAFDDDTVFLAAFKDPANKNLTLVGPKIGGPIWGPGEGYGIRKNEPELKAMFNKAIASALKDGTIKKLSMKWFGVDVAP